MRLSSRPASLRTRSATMVAAIAVLVGACGPSTETPPPTASTAASVPSPRALAPERVSSATHDVPRQPAIPLAAPVGSAGGRFPGGLLIADRGNDRLLVVSSAGSPLWRF